MKILPFMIERLAKFMLNGVVFESAKRIVLTIENSELTGTQKKSAAIDELIKIGYALTGFALSAAVELAWMWMQAQAGKPLFKDR